MDGTLESIVRQLHDSGLVSQAALAAALASTAQPKNVESLLAALVESKHLTRYQAAEVVAGRARSLVLGGYTILDRIGAGGMGQVYKALHRRMDRLVAIKTLPTALLKDPAAVTRFEREVRAAAKLRHPNIVAADDADQADGVHFLVMELVDGRDLSAHLKQHGRLSIADATNYILQAARGLEFAHAQGVVHRDIKPANLLLDAKGVVKILDLGLARIEAGVGSARDEELTNSGAIMGTVDYMAPEQSLDTRRADAKADVYSLGCTFYRLVTGEAPFRGDTAVQKILAHREQPVPSPAVLRPDLPAGLDALCRRMMAKLPADRPTMAELVKHLEPPMRANADRISSSVMIDLQKTTVVDPTSRPTVAKRGSAATQGALVLGIGGIAAIIALVAWFFTRDPNADPFNRAEAGEGIGLVAADSQKSQAAVPPIHSVTPVAAPSGSAVPAVAAPRDFALEFNGATSRVDIPLKATDSNAMTIEGWVRFKVPPRQIAHLISANVSTRRASLYWQRSMFSPDDRKLVSSAIVDGEGRTTYSVDLIEVERWQHVAAVWDGGLQLFVDGRLQGQGFLKVSNIADIAPQIVLGTDYFGKNFLHGALDEVRISKVAIYQGDFTPERRLEKSTATLALYRFDEGQGELLHDASGLGHDGKIVDGTWVSGLNMP